MNLLRLPLFVAVLLGSVACSRGGAEPPRARPAQGPREVTVVAPASHPYAITAVVHGALEPAEAVDVAARIEGPLVSVRADLGDTVQKGQILATIAPSDFRAKQAELDAHVRQAEATLARLERLREGRMATEQMLEEARTSLEVFRAQRLIAQRQVHDTQVRAPFDGAIARRDVSPGAFVRIGTPLFRVVAAAQLRFAMNVPENLAAHVRSGMTAAVSPEDEPSAQVRASITRIAPTIDDTTHTLRVEALMDASPALRPGTFVVGRIELGTAEDAMSIPRVAVVNVLGRDRVLLVRGGKVVAQEVTLVGEESDAAIVRGLSEQERVIVRGGNNLAPGTPVRVTETAIDTAPDTRRPASGASP